MEKKKLVSAELEKLYKENVAREDWCPGCGDFGFLRALNKALVELEIPPWRFVGVPGIGCSGQIFGYINGNVVKADHGRVLPTAFGIKMANKDLVVIGVGGDGDGCSIGMEHFMLVPKTNIDVTYAILDNQTYGLTTGQTSPTTWKGTRTATHPAGAPEEPVNPIACAMTAGATFVARTGSWDIQKTKEVIKAAICHKGFSFIDDFSPCVTFNKTNTHQWFKERVFYIEDEIPNHNRQDKLAALALAEGNDKLALGIFYQVQRPVMEPNDILVDLPLENANLNEILQQYM